VTRALRAGPQGTLRGVYPTPVEPLEALSRKGSALWVKRDDKTHPLYGGNKVRKLERILEEARQKGHARLATVGAAGSHHVLATAVFGAQAGLDVEAAVVPQRRTPHAEENLRADLAAGARLYPRRTYLGAGLFLLSRLGRAYVVPAGGSNVAGAMGYVDAADELAAQVKAGVMPEPDVVVVTVGSGGTAAGLAAGLARTGLRTRVVGVVVATPVFAVAWMTRRLVARCFRRVGGVDRAALRGRLVLDARYLGAGYGEPTAKGAWAEERAAEVGLALDPTYTAKCFGAALDLVRAGEHRTILYWHTLSSAPMGPLLEGAPAMGSIAPGLQRLLRA
jgi:1-aminocyclopropane-1-carboxylate deaminase/D-cysteine desulfhydrase-like pyridoxal-dependent ACC family enzyme